jgi:hypothetical protein
MELAELTKPLEDRASNFSVEVFPRIAPHGSAVWVTCFVPQRYGAGEIRWGIEPFRMAEGSLWRIEYKRLIENVECGQWIVSCEVKTQAGRNERRETPLKVIGGPCPEEIGNVNP